MHNGFVEITINEKKVGIKFNMYAAENFYSVKGIAGTTANVVKMIWAGITANAFVKQVEPEVTFEEVADYVEELTLSGDPDNVVGKITDAFLNAEPVKKLLEKGKEKDLKKKK